MLRFFLLFFIISNLFAADTDLDGFDDSVDYFPNEPNRYQAKTGMLDKSFDVNNKGYVTLDFNTQYDHIYDIEIQTDGKYVVAGKANKLATADPNYAVHDLVVARFNTDGSLDTGFGTNGITTTTLGVDYTQDIRAIDLQSDESIVAVGFGEDNYSGSNFYLILARYDTSGNLDTSFDTDGILTPIISGAVDLGRDIVVQSSDDKIVVVGDAQDSINGDYELFVARFETTGAFDTTFGSNSGFETVDVAGNNDFARTVLLQTDEKIVVIGYSNNGSDDDFFITRFDSTGTLDTNFDTDGIVTIDFASTKDRAFTGFMQGDKIIVAGYSNDGVNDNFALLRLNSDGSIDTTFGEDGTGLVTTHFEGQNAKIYAISEQSDNAIIVAGYTDDGTAATNTFDYALARYSESGVLDKTFGNYALSQVDLKGTLFGNYGTSQVDVQGDQDTIDSILVDNDKLIVVGGSIKSSATFEDFAIARYHLQAPSPITSTAHDFNNDGVSDLLWHNTSTRQNQIWLSANQSTQQVIYHSLNTNWQLIGDADINNDGLRDIVWFKETTGTAFIWPEGDRDRMYYLFKHTSDIANWKIAGVADFDGNGEDDIFWHNIATGANHIWRAGNYQDALNVKNRTDLGWSPVGIGDFNGDGLADIFWHNDGSQDVDYLGHQHIWTGAVDFIGDDDFVDAADFSDLNTQLIGVGDFNNDGIDDALFRNALDNSMEYWPGGDNTSAVSLNPMDVDYQLVGIGDYDQTTAADDIVWRSTSTPESVKIWPDADGNLEIDVTGFADSNWVLRLGYDN